MTRPLRAPARPSEAAARAPKADPPARLRDVRTPDPSPLGFLVNDVARLLRTGFASRVSDAGLGLTGGEARALMHAVNAAGSRQTEIAERMGVEPMTLCGYVDKLEGRGLVERQPHPEDRRAKRIVPTEEAGDALGAIMPLAHDVVDHALEGLPASDVEALRRALEHMRARLTAKD
ncbi:MAG TPA: MarR family winged helix-turn-helix transcriptional regulator [Paracoccaceae bacterium]|nr:MarR family winged helix-turn-helix transcriptional regulator [Paracoccaceae bacterium]